RVESAALQRDRQQEQREDAAGEPKRDHRRDHQRGVKRRELEHEDREDREDRERRDDDGPAHVAEALLPALDPSRRHDGVPGLPRVLRFKAMDAKQADLSALRINRAAEAAAAPSTSRHWRWLAIAVPTAVAVLLGAILFRTTGVLASAVPVRLTRATLASPRS